LEVIALDFSLLGKRIRAERQAKGLSQEQLSELVDCSPTHISHVENASTKISLETFVTLANALQVSTDKLLADSVYQSKAVLTDELAAVFADTTPDQMYVMLKAASTIKDTMTTRRGISDQR
jgi:transcriptional regulator with XRE-family HTH domain